MRLEVGDTAPDFEFVDRQGVKNNFHNVNGHKIVYFYPRAFTATCTKESCSIQGSYMDLKRKGIAEIFGISTDSEGKQEKFSNKYNLQFLMVPDPSYEITKKYGLHYKKFVIFNLARRITFLVDENNKIKAINNPGLKGQRTKYGMDNYGKELLELLD